MNTLFFLKVTMRWTMEIKSLQNKKKEEGTKTPPLEKSRRKGVSPL
jgi:hypothetical protein